VERRRLGWTGKDVSIVGLGTWQLGADWGDVREEDARAVLQASVDAGVTFFDTADVYGDGRSEQIIGSFLTEMRAPVTVATKMGRRLAQVPENYTMANFRAWTERSRTNLQTDTLDLIQLHCPPTATIESQQTYDDLETLKQEGVIAAYGVSVETCVQALTAIERGAATVQLVLNAFRLKPLDQVLPVAQEKGVGVIARVPLASGLLSGRYTTGTRFAPDDHRAYNRHGEAFDQGETFSGVDFEAGVAVAQKFATLAKAAVSEATPAQVAIAWVTQQPGVTVVIPGARNVDQARANAEAGKLAPLGPELQASVRKLYDERLRAAIHGRW
jgi:aryl-alcohol dehydrogenase-like predicted oxidoreductase